MKSISELECERDMKPKKAQLKSYLRRIRRDLMNKEVMCPDDKIVAEYFAKRLSRAKMEKIRSHVAVCDYCIERLKQLDKAEEPTEVRPFMTSEMVREDWRRFEKRIKQGDNGWKKAKTALSLAASLLILFTAGLAAGFYWTRPDYYSLAKINEDVELKKISLFRGTDLLSEGIFALKQQNFTQAEKVLVNYLRDTGDSYEGHYYLGVTLLLKAQTGLRGVFRFRRSYAEKAALHLQRALAKVEGNPRQEVDHYWFLGKAYLMLGEIELASSEYEKILNLPGTKRKREAQELLRKIERLQK